ncbi:hypothetical protein PsAD46_00983 [Pseudovibrio sp. Ad46]|uniref:hypothetical protein n=1 Tax=unclassified Pseudovibrio TaxID=2627060 RepID=UPI0007B24709|nr:MULTISPECIES: hypothetical protein [unclassified Pseudovibrio]KZK94700.1 hypothetical protein PsAD46_00983 [Pseudovibrio sp. Ad46]
MNSLQTASLNVPQELKAIAYEVRRIGTRRRSNPETFLVEKEEASERLLKLAKVLELVQ